MTIHSPASEHAEPSLIEFGRRPGRPRGDCTTWLARGQNFVVELLQAGPGGGMSGFDSPHEVMVIAVDAPARVEAASGSAELPVRSVAVMPAGAGRVHLAAHGRCAVLASSRLDLPLAESINAAQYAQADPRIVPSTPAYERAAAAGIEVFEMSRMQAPADNPRLKMLQSSTMSINWVEYHGERDRGALSPHSHANFEQGSLGLAGRFLHHLRQPWGRDARLWRDDKHCELDSPSLMVVPVNIIHTSEGVGEGHHLLIDIFSPPRQDFIGKGWVANAAAYRAPEPAQ